jgi:hypothetical protein
MAHGGDMNRLTIVDEEFDEAITQAIETIISNGNILWTGKELREWLEGEGFRIIKIKSPKAE